MSRLSRKYIHVYYNKENYQLTAVPNPNPSRETRFKAESTESLTRKIQVRIYPSVWAELEQQSNWQQFVRDAISEKLLRDEQNKG